MESAALAQHATTLFNMARYAEAQATLEETLPIFQRSGHRYREAIDLGNLAGGRDDARAAGPGRALGRRGDPRSPWTSRSGRPPRRTSWSSAWWTCSTGRFTEFETRFRTALEIARDVGAKALEVDLLARRVTSAMLQRDHDAVLEMAHEAVEASRTTQSDLDRGHAQLGLGYAGLVTGALGRGGERLPRGGYACSRAWASRPGRHHGAGRRGSDAAAASTRRCGCSSPCSSDLDRDGLSGTALPGEMLRIGHEVLAAAGDPRADEVLKRARAYLLESAAEIGDDEMSPGYLALPVHASCWGALVRL